jgi:hypothetical protein
MRHAANMRVARPAVKRCGETNRAAPIGFAALTWAMRPFLKMRRVGGAQLALLFVAIGSTADLTAQPTRARAIGLAPGIFVPGRTRDRERG